MEAISLPYEDAFFGQRYFDGGLWLPEKESSIMTPFTDLFLPFTRVDRMLVVRETTFRAQCDRS